MAVAPAASFQLQPPAPFNFNQPEEWPRWKSRFEQLRLASGLSAAEDEQQVSTLLYCLGEQAEEVLWSANTSTADRPKHDTLMTKLDSFFKVRKNVIYERAKFNRCVQQLSETAEQFIITRYNLSECCEYRTMRNELLRDRLVVGT